jgi:predicted  nucleic acid-binding Zn-ribbon protein
MAQRKAPLTDQEKIAAYDKMVARAQRYAKGGKPVTQLKKDLDKLDDGERLQLLDLRKQIMRANSQREDLLRQVRLLDEQISEWNDRRVALHKKCLVIVKIGD